MTTSTNTLLHRLVAGTAVAVAGIATLVAVPEVASSPAVDPAPVSTAGGSGEPAPVEPAGVEQRRAVVRPASHGPVSLAPVPVDELATAEGPCPEGFAPSALAGCVREVGDGLTEVHTDDGSTVTVVTPHTGGGQPAHAADDDGHDERQDEGHDEGHDDGDAARLESAGTRSWGMDDVSRRPVSCARRGAPRTVAVHAHVPGTSHAGSPVHRRIRAVVERSNQLVAASARGSGGPVADLRFACNRHGRIAVVPVEAPEPGYHQIRQAVIDAGWSRDVEKYLVFADAKSPHGGVAGMAQRFDDDRRVLDNHNNGVVPMYGVVWSGNWTNLTPLHELTHMMGGVQPDSPGSDGHGHCTDSRDVMCYTFDDRGCATFVYDCGHDTYFSTAAARGSYLATNWNIGWAGNRFVDVAGRPTPNAAPTASFTASCDDRDCAFDARGSSDTDGRIRGVRWDFGDGTKARGRRHEHTYEQDGTYTVRVTVTDDRGGTDRTTREVEVSTPLLTEATDDLDGATPSDPPDPPALPDLPDRPEVPDVLDQDGLPDAEDAGEVVREVTDPLTGGST